jgi:hypothetical protein
MHHDAPADAGRLEDLAGLPVGIGPDGTRGWAGEGAQQQTDDGSATNRSMQDPRHIEISRREQK